MPGDKRGWPRIKALMLREPWWAEFWAAISAGGWAAWSALSHEDLADRPAYRQVVAFAGEEFWQITGAVLCIVQVIALYRDARVCRRGACFLASWWWTFLFLAVLLVDPRAPGLWLFAVFLCVNLHSIARLRQEVL